MEHAYIEGYAAKLLGWPTEGEGVWSINVGVAPLGSGFGVVNLPETQRQAGENLYQDTQNTVRALIGK